MGLDPKKADHLFSSGQRLFTLSLSIPTVILGLMALYGWIFEVPWLVQIHPRNPPISFNGTLILLLGTISLIALVIDYRKAAHVLALIVILSSSLFIIEALFKVNLGIDELLLKSKMDFGLPYPGRPATNSMLSTLFIGLILFVMSWPTISIYSLVLSALGCIVIIGININSIYGFLLGVEDATMWYDLSTAPLLGDVLCTVFAFSMLYFTTSIFYNLYPLESVFLAPSLFAISGICVIIVVFLSYLAEESLSTEKTMEERADYFTSIMEVQIPKEFNLLNQYKNLLDSESIWDKIATMAFEVSPALRELVIINSNGNLLNQKKRANFHENINYSSLTNLFQEKENPLHVLDLQNRYIILWVPLSSQKFLVSVYDPESLLIPEVMMKWMKHSNIYISYNDIPVINKKDLTQPDQTFTYEFLKTPKSDQIHLKMELNPYDITRVNSALIIMTLPLIVLLFFIAWIIYFFQKVKIVSIDLQKALQTQTIFLANISHDMRTPLHGLTGAADLLGNTELNTKQADLLKLINLSNKDLKDLVSNILDITKMESGRSLLVMTKCDVVKLCEQYINDLQSVVFKKDIQFIFDYPKQGIPLLLLPEAAYSAVLNNLLSNAFAFTQKGNITLRLEFNHIDRKRGVLRTIISDTGTGIHPEKLPYLFYKFRPPHLEREKTTAEGAGLGLYLTKLILDAMNGTIEVKSEMNRGSTFTVSIPVDISGVL